MKKDIIFHLFCESMKMCDGHKIIDKNCNMQALIGNTFEIMTGDTKDGNTMLYINGFDRKGNVNCYVTKSTTDGYEFFAKLIDYDYNKMTWKKSKIVTKDTFIRNFKKFYNDAKTHIRFCKEWNMDPWKYLPTIC